MDDLAKTSWNLNLEEIIPGWVAVLQPRRQYLIGVLPGEGIGPEIIAVTLQVLEAAARNLDIPLTIRIGGEIGIQAWRQTGAVLPAEVTEFCQSVFDQGGSILCGPGGGRFVYELRAHFDLFCKIIPVRPLASLLQVGAIKPESKEGVDILVVRENTSGAYFGRWDKEKDKNGLVASHQFEYREKEVERIVRVALELARRRRHHLTVVLKSEGLPSISRLWLEVAERLVRGAGVRLEVLQMDNAVYQLIQSAGKFDVLVTSNLFGDILADCAGALLGSRGLSFSGNFGDARKAVYQTGHGCAYDIVGRNLANPVGQILSLIMLLRVSFGLAELASCLLAAVEKTLLAGWRTADMASPGTRTVGTREMGQRIIQSFEISLAWDKNEKR
jgi:3-isopropylmalate dehydrogenase